MTNVSPIRIDINDGRLPLKGKGLEMTEFANTAELRRNQLEKLAAGFRMFAYFGFNEGCLLYTSPSPRDRQKSRMPSSA